MLKPSIEKCIVSQWSQSFEIIIEEVNGGFGKGELVPVARGGGSLLQYSRQEGVLQGLGERREFFQDEFLFKQSWEFYSISVKSVGAKRFTLVFLEDRGAVGGWSIMAKKLRDLGVVSFPQIQSGEMLHQGLKEGSRRQVMLAKGSFFKVV